MTISSDKFSYNSAFRNDAGLQSVRFAYDAPLLEVELNEVQEIQNELRRSAIRNILPSGFLELVSKNFNEAPIVYNPVSSYNPVLNSIAIAPAKAILNGYIVNIKGAFSTDEASDYTLVNLGEAPYTGLRDDFVYLEAWLEKVAYDDNVTKEGYRYGSNLNYKIKDSRVDYETTRRVILKYDIKVFHGVDFDEFPNGFGYNSANSFSPIYASAAGRAETQPKDMMLYRSASDIVFKDCEFYKDYNLYVAGRPGYTFTVDTIVGNYIFALPMFRIKRRNKAQYNIKNYNGSRSSIYKYTDENSSKKGDLLGNIRPDKLYYDVIDKTDIIDLRRSISFDAFNNYYLNLSLKKLFRGELETKDTLQMKRVQFGRERLDYKDEISKGLFLNITFDNESISPDYNTDSLCTYAGEEPVYKDGVSGLGLYVNGKTEYIYGISSLTSTQGTVDFYIQPYWNGYDKRSQVICRITNGNDHPIFLIRKINDKLYVDTYKKEDANYDLSVFDEDEDTLVITRMIIDFTTVSMIAHMIYHMRLSWNSGSNIAEVRLYMNGNLIGKAPYMGSTISPNKIIFGSQIDYLVPENVSDEDTPYSDINKQTNDFNETNISSDGSLLRNAEGYLTYTQARLIAKCDDNKIYPIEDGYISTENIPMIKSIRLPMEDEEPIKDSDIEKIRAEDAGEEMNAQEEERLKKDARTVEKISYGFVLEEINVYDRSFETRTSDGIDEYVTNTYWPKLSQDFISGKVEVNPSFNSVYRNYSDNDIIQDYTTEIVHGEAGKFIITPPDNTRIVDKPTIYKLNGEYDINGKVITMPGTWSYDEDTGIYTFQAKDTILQDAIVSYTIYIPNGNGGEDLPNEILAAGLIDTSNVLEECGFARLTTTEPRKVVYSNPARVSASVDEAFDFSTNRTTRQCYARLLYYHMSGNGTNIYKLPYQLYGCPILNVINATNRKIKNVIRTDVEEEYDSTGTIEVVLESIVPYGDVLELQIALGGWLFDYETQTKTLVANLHKTKMLKVVADGDNNEFIIPCYEPDGNGGILKAVCNVLENTLINGKVAAQENKYACFIDGEMYPKMVKTIPPGIEVWENTLCEMQVDESSFNTPFLKITLGFTPYKGQVLQIPVIITYQPKATEVLSIWYKYIPYQGILGKKHKKLKRLTEWKYFITTLSSGNDSLSIDQYNVNSLQNVVNRLPGGLSYSSLITGEDILFKGEIKKYDANYKLRFVNDALFTALDNNLDDAFFELDSEMEVYRLTTGFQDERLRYTFNSFKTYLPENMYRINKYTGMASIVVDETGEILLFVIGCLNNGEISYYGRAENVLMPMYGDLFRLPGRPTMIHRN